MSDSDTNALAEELELAAGTNADDIALGALVRTCLPTILAALRSAHDPEGMGETQGATHPSPGLAMSMALRYDHAIARPSYYDWDTLPGHGRREEGRHAKMLAGTITTMQQLWEEATGRGFYKPEREAEYVAMAARCGVTFMEGCFPVAAAPQPPVLKRVAAKTITAAHDPEGIGETRAEPAETAEQLVARLEQELGVKGISAVFRRALALAKEATADARRSVEPGR